MLRVRDDARNPPKAILRAVERRDERDGVKTLSVSFLPGDPFGVAAEIQGDECVCHSIFVPKWLRRNGVGRKLMSFVEEFARDSGVETVIAGVSADARNHGFWESLGFAKTASDGPLLKFRKTLTPNPRKV